MKNLSTSKTHFQYQAELAGSFGRNPQIGMLNITGNHYTEPDLDSNDPKSKDSLCFLSTDRKKDHELSDRPSFDHRSSANTGVRTSVIEHPHFRTESELESDVSARESAKSTKRQRDSLSYRNDMKNVSKLLENITKDLHEAKLDMQLRKFSRNSEEQKDSAVSTVLPSQTEVDSVKLSSPEKRLSSKKSFSSAQEIPSQSEIDNDLISKIDTERQNTEKRMTARNPSPPPEDYITSKFNEGRHNRGSKSSIPDLQQVYGLNYLKGNRANNEYQKNATASNFFQTFRQESDEKRDYNELNHMLQQEKSRNGKLENKLQDMEALLQQMRMFGDKLYQNYVETKDELQAGKTGLLSAKVQESTQNEKLKSKLDDLQKMNHNLSEENKHLKESNKKKTDVIGKLEDQVKAAKSENAILKEKHQAKVESLMSMMRKLEKENLENVHHMRENSKGSMTYRKDPRMETEGFSDRSKDYLRHDHSETFVDSDRKSRNSEIPEVMLQTQRELVKYKEETESVKRENRKLRLELQSLNYSRKSCDLREALQQVENVTQNLKIQASENKKMPSPNLMFKTLTDISIEIEVENLNAILPKIKEIQEENRTNKKFVDSFLDLVYKCSPPGNFEKKPTVKQGWKWMKRLMEEYMEMRREGKNDTLRESDLIKKLAAYMGVKNKEDLLSKVKDLINENGLMNKVISKIKTIYHLEWTSPIQELDKKLEMLMNNAGSGGRTSNKMETIRSSNLLTQKLDNK